MADRSPLRERQAAVVRDAILDALAVRLGTENPEDVALPQVAQDAGVSTRTLYRYFATRAELFAAAGDHIVARLGLRISFTTPEEISADFLRAASAGAVHPQLMKSLLYSSLGRRARSAHRERRVQAMLAALGGITSHLEPGVARRRSAAIAFLSSMAAWVTICEETGLSAADAQQGVAWAIDTLVGALRRENAEAVTGNESG
jgi:AcrR family transcriptional regulator